jgi:fructose/tagatose bisphosphate aldolase
MPAALVLRGSMWYIRYHDTAGAGTTHTCPHPRLLKPERLSCESSPTAAKELLLLIDHTKFGKVAVPFDLHGGSSIDADSLRAAIRLGVAKVCYGTYVKQRYLEAVRRVLGIEEENPHKRLGCGGPEDVLVAGRLAVRDAVLERIETLGCCGRA